MHELITRYPGSPGDEHWWFLLDDQEVAWRKAYARDLPERLLSWDTPPPDGEAIEELRVLVRDDAIVRLPTWVRALRRLRYLEFPLRLAKTLTAEDVPPSVEVIHFAKSGTTTLPKALVLPGVRFVICHEGTLKFTHDTFPSLTRLSLGLDRPQAMLKVIGTYAGQLEALHLSSVNPGALFECIERLPLRYLGLVDGKLDSLQGIGALEQLTSLQLKTLGKLTGLTGLEDAKGLQELSIGYCNALTDVRPVAGLPALRELSFFGVRKVGVTEILPALEAMRLQKLSLAGAT